jgi:hypothetical protein
MKWNCVKGQIEAFPRLPSTFSLLGIVIPMCPTTLNQSSRIKHVQIVTSLNHWKGLEEYNTIGGCMLKIWIRVGSYGQEETWESNYQNDYQPLFYCFGGSNHL